MTTAIKDKDKDVLEKDQNAMAGQKPICPILQSHYDRSPQEKRKFLKTAEARYLLSKIPMDVSRILMDGFLYGKKGEELGRWDIVADYFYRNSRIIPALIANPGTYTMLEKMYHFEPVFGPIDTYFKMCKAGGQALSNRFQTVNAHAISHINEILASQENCLAIDIGSGPGRNGIEMSLKNENFRNRLKVDCIDIDSDAVNWGRTLVARNNLTNIEFVEKSMTRQHKRYRGTVDYGLLIGILCGLTLPERVGLLKIIKPYFKPGAKLVAASLLEKMAEDDLLCAYILRETADWQLQFPPLGQLKLAFETAGWKYEGYFQEEPTRMYEIGIGVA